MGICASNRVKMTYAWRQSTCVTSFVSVMGMRYSRMRRGLRIPLTQSLAGSDAKNLWNCISCNEAKAQGSSVDSFRPPCAASAFRPFPAPPGWMHSSSNTKNPGFTAHLNFSHLCNCLPKAVQSHFSLGLKAGHNYLMSSPFTPQNLTCLFTGYCFFLSPLLFILSIACCT